MTQGELNQKLLAAVCKNNINGMKEAISLGADVNLKNNEWDTALMYTAYWGRTDIARLLIEHGADVNAVDKYGNTALMWACEYGHIEIVQLLLEYGVDVNGQDKYGNTALINACRWGHTEIAKLLIEHGAYINIRNDNGQTAMDILRENYPNKYETWIQKTVVKPRQKKLYREDVSDTCGPEPDFNI